MAAIFTWGPTGPAPRPGWNQHSLYIDTLVAANSQPEAGELTKPGSCASILAAKGGWENKYLAFSASTRVYLGKRSFLQL